MMKTKRIKNDYYPTEENLTHKLLEICPEIRGTILEPTSGENHIADILKSERYNGRFPYVMTNDIDQDRPSDFHFDAACSLNKFGKIFPAYDWVVGNMPFSLMHIILPNSFYHANRGVAVLARISYMEPTMKRNVRGDCLKEFADNMSHFIIFGNTRPKFRQDKKGTDSVTTAFFVWDKKHSWKKLGIACPFSFVTDWKL